MQPMQQKVLLHILFTVLERLIQVYTLLEKTLLYTLMEKTLTNVCRNTNKPH